MNYYFVLSTNDDSELNLEVDNGARPVADAKTQDVLVNNPQLSRNPVSDSNSKFLHGSSTRLDYKLGSLEDSC